MSSRRRKGRRSRSIASTKRRLLIVASALGLVWSMTVSVRRTAVGQRISEAITEMDQEERLLRAQLADEIVRVDSLESRPRIARVAAELGLRQATDTQVRHLEDPQ